MTEKIQSLNVRNKTFIVITGRVDQNDVMRYIKNKIKNRKFFKCSVFKIYAGAHGYKDGRLGDKESETKQLETDINAQIRGDVEDAREDGLFEPENMQNLHDRLQNASGVQIMEKMASKDLARHIRKAISLIRKEEKDIIDDMEYNLNNPDEVGKETKHEDLEDNHEAIFDDLFNSMTERNKPYVIFLAFCFSDRNEITYYMAEHGIVAASAMKHERGEITRGRWFKLDEGQEDILKSVRIGHKSRGKFDMTKNLLLAGSSGTGKTIVLAEAMHMRIAHYMRERVPLDIIIAS